MTHTLEGLDYKAAQNLSAMGGVGGRTAKTKQELDEQSCQQTRRSWSIPGLRDINDCSSIKEFASTLLCPAYIHQLSVVVTSS